MACAGCEAKDQELAYLRQQLEVMQDRVFAMANPTGYQIFKGVPLDQASDQTPDGQAPTFRDEHGREYVFVAGRRVPAEEYFKMQSRLEEHMSGRAGWESEAADIPL